MNKNIILYTSTVLTLLLSFNIMANQEIHQTKQTKLMSGLDTKAAEVVTKFHQALRSKDTDSVRSLLSDDVLIYESGKAERSLEEYASGHMKSDMRYLAQIKSELIEHQVKVSGDMAVSTARFENTRMVAGRARVNITMETIVVSKINDKWLITHIHWS